MKNFDEKNTLQKSEKRIAILGSFLTNPNAAEYRVAEKLGFILAQCGYSVICGGHSGIMESVAKGSTEAGGEIIGISLVKSKRIYRSSVHNPFINTTILVDSISDRLEIFAQADGYVFFTGGIGTLVELAYIWHSLQVAGQFTKPIIFMSPAWKQVFIQVRQYLMIKLKYYRYLHFCDDAEEAVAILVNDYSKNPKYRVKWQKKCILLDLDGTIVVSPEEEFTQLCQDFGYFFYLPDVITAYKQARLHRTNSKGKNMAREEARKYNLNILENLNVNLTEANELFEYLYAEFQKKQVPDLYPDVKDTLRYVKSKGISIGVLSSRHPTQIEKIIEHHKLTDFLDFMIGASTKDQEKPNTILFEEALALSKFEKSDILYVGDMYTEDYVTPRTIQIDSILLDRHLLYLTDTNVHKIRSLRELQYMVKINGED